MSENKLSELLEDVELQHDKTLSVFQVAELDTATRKEYLRQIEQYESMYKSLDQMKAIATQPETVESLVEKMVALLKERLEFEKYCEKQFS